MTQFLWTDVVVMVSVLALGLAATLIVRAGQARGTGRRYDKEGQDLIAVSGLDIHTCPLLAVWPLTDFSGPDSGSDDTISGEKK